MLMTKPKNSADHLIAQIIHGIEEVKGIDTSLLDLRSLDNTVCDFFIVCSGTSNTHVNAIVSTIQKVVSKSLKEKPYHTEGLENAEWVLMDYINVVVHVFQRSTIEFYNIEELWGDAKTTQVASNY
jgi:ribosome-associated protein